jgi:hypothetical protein
MGYLLNGGEKRPLNSGLVVSYYLIFLVILGFLKLTFAGSRYLSLLLTSRHPCLDYFTPSQSGLDILSQACCADNK